MIPHASEQLDAPETMPRAPLNKTGPMTDAERQLKVMEELRRAGGGKVAAKLDQEYMSYLYHVMELRGCETKQDAIREAIRLVATGRVVERKR